MIIGEKHDSYVTIPGMQWEEDLLFSSGKVDTPQDNSGSFWNDFLLNTNQFVAMWYFNMKLVIYGNFR